MILSSVCYLPSYLIFGINKIDFVGLKLRLTFLGSYTKLVWQGMPEIENIFQVNYDLFTGISTAKSSYMESTIVMKLTVKQKQFLSTQI